MKKTHHWLDIAEYATLVGLGVGSITSFVFSQFFYASAPLSLLVLLNLANRNRLEQEMRRRTQQAIAQIDYEVSQNLDRLNQQIQTLPTTEAMGSLRKSMLVKNREMAERLSGEIKTLQDGVQAVLVMIERLNLGTVRQDLDVVRKQYESLNNGVTSLTSQVQQMVTSGRFDQMEHAIAQLRQNTQKLEAHIQSLADQTKPTLTALQDQISHLNRQFQKLPPPFDASALRQEVAELTRMVSDLVPKRDLTLLSTELQRLQTQQESQLAAEESLRRKLQEISLQLRSRPTKSSLTSLQNQINHLNRQVQKLPPPFDATSLRQEVAKMLKIVSNTVPRRDFSGLIAQVKSLQQQQEFQLKIERTLQKELQSLGQQVQELMENPPAATDLASAPAPPSDSQVFQDRLETVLRQELAQISQQLRDLPTDSELESHRAIALQQELVDINQQLQRYPEGPQYEFVLDFKSSELAAGRSALPNSRRILEEALERSQEQLIIILPWSSQVRLDDTLLGQMEAFLRQKRHLHVGWCHQTDRTQHRFLKAIQQRWQEQPEQQSTLQETLQRLLQLKRIDPQRFQFQIMGTRENFLVSDQQYAVLGMDDALVGTSLPDIELKLRTTDEGMVQQLSQRFGQPTLQPTDVAAHWNLMATRYDLGDRQGALDGCNQILAITPDDANALNFRGILHYEMGDRTLAMADFEQAIKCDPHNIAPYCNRGYIRAEQADQLGAIADYSAALRVDAESGLPYFLRGLSCQKFGEIEGALADYDEALRRIPDSPVLFYYRGLTRTKVGDFGGAIGDLQQALEGFTQQRNETNARKVFGYLEQMLQAHPDAIVPPPNTPAISRSAAATAEPTTPKASEAAPAHPSTMVEASDDISDAGLQSETASEQSDTNSRFTRDEGLELSEFTLSPLSDEPSDRLATEAGVGPVTSSEVLASDTPAINGVHPTPFAASETVLPDEASPAVAPMPTESTKAIATSQMEDTLELERPAEFIQPNTAANAASTVDAELDVPEAIAQFEGPVARPNTVTADEVILLPPSSASMPSLSTEHPAIKLGDPANERLADLEDPLAEENIAGEATPDAAVDEDITLVQTDESEESAINGDQDSRSENDDVDNPFRLPADQAMLFASAASAAPAAPATATTSGSISGAAINEAVDEAVIVLGPVPEAPIDVPDDSVLLSQDLAPSERNLPPTATAEPEPTTGTLSDFFGAGEDGSGQTETLLPEREPSISQPELAATGNPDALAEPPTIDTSADEAIASSTASALEPITNGETLADFFDLDEDELVDAHPDAERLAAQDEASNAVTSTHAPAPPPDEEPTTTTETLFSFFNAENEPQAIAQVSSSSEPAAESFPSTPNVHTDQNNVSADSFGMVGAPNTEQPSRDSAHQEAAEVGSLTQLSIPPSDSQYIVDLANLTLSKFLDDLNQAWEIEPDAPWAEEASAKGGAIASNSVTAASTTDPLEEARPSTPDSGTLTDFCGQF